MSSAPARGARVAPAEIHNGGTVYTLIGSQFGAKVIAAMDAVGVPHRVHEIGTRELRNRRRWNQILAPPHTVPQMDWRGERLTDSTDILKAIDRDADGQWKLYPEEQRAAVEALEQHVGTVFNAYVMYFTWWVEAGFRATYCRRMARDLFCVPLPACIGRHLMRCIVPIGRLRGSMRKKARAVLGDTMITPGRYPAADEEDKVRAALVAELRALDGRLAAAPPAPKRWLCRTDHPSAADFALYGCLERLVGESGDSNMGTATPWLFAEANVAEVQAWHARMLAAHPIRFLGK